MQTGEVGFMSSWRMLTRDKGWVKPLLVLTLVSWIPIFGRIAVLGYGLEWARLTAWGAESAPKQRGVDYGKVISTGARAFLITISQAFVCGLVLQILFPGFARRIDGDDHGRQRSCELGHPGFRDDVLPARPRYHGVRRYVFAGGGAARETPYDKLFRRIVSTDCSRWSSATSAAFARSCW